MISALTHCLYPWELIRQFAKAFPQILLSVIHTDLVSTSSEAPLYSATGNPHTLATNGDRKRGRFKEFTTSHSVPLEDPT